MELLVWFIPRQSPLTLYHNRPKSLFNLQGTIGLYHRLTGREASDHVWLLSWLNMWTVLLSKPNIYCFDIRIHVFSDCLIVLVCMCNRPNVQKSASKGMKWNIRLFLSKNECITVQIQWFMGELKGGWNILLERICFNLDLLPFLKCINKYKLTLCMENSFILHL